MAAEEVEEILTHVCDWDFDVFRLEELTGGKALSILGRAAFERLGLLEAFNIELPSLTAFLEAIEREYENQPYHNSAHAADVTQAVLFFLTTGGASKVLSQEEIFALVFSAVVHDTGHKGTSNSFEIATLTKLALVYNDSSPLENHHIAQAFQIAVSDESLNIFSGCMDKFKELRRLSISFVLSTDIGAHANVINVYRENAQRGEVDLETGLAADSEILCRLLMQSADVSNAARPRKFALRWAARIMNEFFSQGNREKELGLPVSPGMDSAVTTVPKCQVGFISFLVRARFEALSERFPVLCSCFNSLEENTEFWRQAKAEDFDDRWIAATCASWVPSY